MNKQKFAALALAITAIVAVGGCQSGSDAGDDSVESLKARAVQRWNYLIEKKAEKAYEYLTPGYRKSKSLEQYVAEKSSVGLNWKHASAGKTECEEDVCTVFVSLDYEVSLPNTGGKPIETFAPLREKWVKLNGKWYFLPDK